MPKPDLEIVRAAMFADPGVKAVDDLRWMPAASGLGIQATVTVASSAVDLATVQAVVGQILATQFGVTELHLTFNDPGPRVQVHPTALVLRPPVLHRVPYHRVGLPAPGAGACARG